MKTISNKVTKIILRTEQKIVVENGPVETVHVFATFGDLLLLTINMAPQQGFSITDIKARLKLADAIEKGKGDGTTLGDIIIEDTELPILKSSFDAFKWTVIHKDIVELSDLITSL